VALAAAAPPTVVGHRAQPPPATPSPIGEEEEIGERREHFLVREEKREKIQHKMSKKGSHNPYILPLNRFGSPDPTQGSNRTATSPTQQAQRAAFSP